MKKEILNIETVHQCNCCMGCKTLHPLVSVVDLFIGIGQAVGIVGAELAGQQLDLAILAYNLSLIHI